MYERDRSGAWIVSVPAVRGAHTYGRTIEQARSRLDETLRLFDVDPSSVVILHDVRLPRRLREAVRRARRARQQAEVHRAAAQAQLRVTAHALQLAGLSRRDAGLLLGLSRQRVQQLRTA